MPLLDARRRRVKNVPGERQPGCGVVPPSWAWAPPQCRCLRRREHPHWPQAAAPQPPCSSEGSVSVERRPHAYC